MSHPIRASEANSSPGQSNGPQVSVTPVGNARNFWSDLGPFSQFIIEAAVMLAIAWGLIAYYSANGDSLPGPSSSSKGVVNETISAEAKN